MTTAPSSSPARSLESHADDYHQASRFETKRATGNQAHLVKQAVRSPYQPARRIAVPHACVFLFYPRADQLVAPASKEERKRKENRGKAK